MNKEEADNMKSYIKPKQYWYGSKDHEFTMEMPMTKTIVKKLGKNAVKDRVDDIVLEVYYDLIKRDKYYSPYMFIRTVMTNYIRWIRHENGMNQKTGEPLIRNRFYIINDEDESIEKIGKVDDWWRDIGGE